MYRELFHGLVLNSSPWILSRFRNFAFSRLSLVPALPGWEERLKRYIVRNRAFRIIVVMACFVIGPALAAHATYLNDTPTPGTDEVTGNLQVQGNITTPSGTIIAGTTITAGTSVSAGTTLTAGTNISAGGTITATTTITAGTNITAGREQLTGATITRRRRNPDGRRVDGRQYQYHRKR